VESCPVYSKQAAAPHPRPSNPSYPAQRPQPTAYNPPARAGGNYGGANRMPYPQQQAQTRPPYGGEALVLRWDGWWVGG